MTQSHYETLGVPQQVTPEEIKKARNRMVRLYPPEQHPEKFKQIDLAFKTLSDPVARADYDADLAHGPELRRLAEEAEALCEKDDWAGAARLYKELVVLHPASHGGWNRLGICHTRAKAWSDAKRAYARLVRDVGDSALYWMNYAWVFINEAGELPLEDEGRKPLAREARRLLEPALRIAPDDAEVYETIARTHACEQDYRGAIEWIDKAIGVDRAGPNAETYFLLAQMTRLSGNPEGVMAVADRLVAALPPDPTARRDAARVFARSAVSLHEGHVFPAALLYMKAAARIAPDDEAIRDVLAQWNQSQAASDQYDVMAKDPVVIPPIRYWLAVLTDEARNLEVEEPRDEILRKVNEAIPTYDDAEVVAAARQVRVKYPALYRLCPDDLDKLERPKGTPPAAAPPPAATWSPAAPPPAATSSSCFVVTATFGGPGEPIVGEYRRFRDEYLSQRPLGRALVRLYQRVGPGMAWAVRRSPALRNASAAVLVRLARLLPQASSR